MNAMQVIVDGLPTHYELGGKGKTVVFLHGWGDRAAGSAQLRAELARQYTVVAPDLPGFGGTAAPPKVWNNTDYAEFVAALLRKIGQTQVYALIGHSNGGAIAVRGLGRHILTAEKVVLVASAGIRGEYKGRTRALRYLAKTGKVLAAPLPASVKQRLRRKVYQTIGSDMLVAEQLQETFKKVVTDDVRADAARVDIPALLLYGEDDPQTPVRYGELFHEYLRDSTLEIFPAAGHFVHLDRPQEVLRAIEEFLQ